MNSKKIIRALICFHGVIERTLDLNARFKLDAKRYTIIC